MALPLIPFAKLPYKEWKNNETEKKPRLPAVEHENKIFRINNKEDKETSQDKKLKERDRVALREKRLEARRRRFGIVDESSEEEESSEGDSDSSSEYDLLEHIKELLPDEVTKYGEKPKKKANSLHLQDLKVVKKKRNYFSFVNRISKSIEDFKARERERRKHHLLRHFEERVKEYDLRQKQLFDEFLERKRNEELLEEHRRQQRIERNSRKKVEKKLLADQFSEVLERREREDHQMLFFSEFFPKWRAEEMDYHDEQQLVAAEEARQREKERREWEEKESRRLLIESDAKLIQEDEELTKQVEAIMLKSGTIYYQKKVIANDNEVVKNVFEKNKAYKVRQKSLQDEKDQTMKEWREREEERDKQLIEIANGGTPSINYDAFSSLSSMELLLDTHAYTEEDFQGLYKQLKTIKLKRNHKIYGYFCPFRINLAEITSTNEITKVKGRHWKEVGLFAFCYEMTQNGHFLMIRDLDLGYCYMRNIGMTQLLYHLKINNLFALQSWSLSANYLSHAIANSFLETAKLNLFQNLQKLDLSKNELGDQGITELIIPLIIHKYVMNLQELLLRQNSITNHGFEAIMKILIPLQEPCIPQIHRIALENNLIDGKCRRPFFPLPAYISV